MPEKIDKLEKKVEKLQELLSDAEPGCSTWHEAVYKAIQEVAQFVSEDPESEPERSGPKRIPYGTARDILTGASRDGQGFTKLGMVLISEGLDPHDLPKEAKIFKRRTQLFECKLEALKLAHSWLDRMTCGMAEAIAHEMEKRKETDALF